MSRVPETVGESLVPHNVEVATTEELGFTDPETGRFELLSREQLQEVAAVYNNWRCGNYESCMLDNAQAFGKVRL